MSTVFTESYAAYLFIILAIIMMICGFIFKDRGGKWLFYLAMFGFIMGGFYAFSVQASLTAFVHWLGLFCILAAFGCMLMPVMMRPKKEPPPELRKLTSDEYTDYLRALRYGKRAGYDKTGREMQRW